MGGGAGHCCRIPSSSSSSATTVNRFRPPAVSIVATASAKRNETSMIPIKKSKQRLITISTAEGRWQGKWNCDYTFSLKKLQLQDLLEDVRNDADVSISLDVQKHAGLGMSVEGRISTCFTTKCCNCCSPYLREINSKFKVWVLPWTRQIRDTSQDQHPIIGGDDHDPSVIYVKPGYEADLDSLVQDTIRLATSVNETCSESCEKSEPKLEYIGTQNAASVEKRWQGLLELKKKR